VLLLGVVGCGRIDFEESAIPRDGLVAYYPLDDLDNGRTFDEVANIAATCDGACPTLTTGHAGRAMQFFSERLDVPSTAAVNGTSTFTIAAWVLPVSFPSGAFSCAVTKAFGLTTANSWTICTSQAGQVFFGTSTAVGETLTQNSIVALSPLRWNHVAVTFDGTTKSIFIDGVFDGAALDGTVFDTGRISIGADYDNMSTEFYSGIVDEVVIYNRVLYPDEIQLLAR
jgi:hypothetical protein